MSDRYPSWLVEGVEAELDADIKAAWARLRQGFVDSLGETAKPLTNGLAEWLPPPATHQDFDELELKQL